VQRATAVTYVRWYFPTRSDCEATSSSIQPLQHLQALDQLVERLRLGGAPARWQERLDVLAANRLQERELVGRHPSRSHFLHIMASAEIDRPRSS
jgi:hypothetical protein